jgi:hypothetical protein
MKLTPWYLVAIAPIAVAGCSGAFLGHLAVLAVTLCIFIGTLSLGRASRQLRDMPFGQVGSPSARPQSVARSQATTELHKNV